MLFRSGTTKVSRKAGAASKVEAINRSQAVIEFALRLDMS